MIQRMLLNETSYFGPGAIEKIPDEVREHCWEKALIVTDRDLILSLIHILLVTRWRGYYRARGEPARELRPGDVVNIPPDVKHWHGAAPDSWFSHLAVEVPADGGATE